MNEEDYGNIYDIQKGHGRFGFRWIGNRVAFVVSVSEKEAEIGIVPPDMEEDKLDLTALFVHSVEQVEALGKYFLEIAEKLREKNWKEEENDSGRKEACSEE